MADTREDDAANAVIHVRRAELSDAAAVDCLVTNETLAIFGRFNVVAIMYVVVLIHCTLRKR